MKRNRYILDPVCVMAGACYAVNRWLVPTAVKGGFLRGYFSDVLLIPAALPLMLALQRWIGLRTHDAPPRWREIVFHLAIWSFAAEVLAPRLWTHATGDAIDVLAYAGGALVAGLWWHAP